LGSFRQIWEQAANSWKIVEMFQIYVELSEDRTQASVQLPSMGGPQMNCPNSFATLPG
jgi:hypothetical protein